MTTPRLSLPTLALDGSDSLSPPVFNTFFTNLDKGIGYTFCTSSTKPATPYACQLIYLTDTWQEQIWDPVANAWITLVELGMGVYALSQTATAVNGTLPTNEYMCGTITANLDSGSYNIHAEGMVSWNSNYSASTQPTQQGLIRVRTASGATVTTSSTLQGSRYCDAWAPKNASQLLAQVNFACDVVFAVGTPGQFTAGWSYQINSLPPGASSFNLTNVLMYLEKVGN